MRNRATKKAAKRLVKPRGGKDRPGTALARRPYVPAPMTGLIVNDPHQLLGTLGDDDAVGLLGQVEVKLTAEEEAILSEAVNPDDVRVKPSGQPYLSHPTYTRWFNRAFGRLGWAIVPLSKPARTVEGSKVSVVCPYMLYIHGQPAARAHGEQEYFADSREQTYGDALEATVASALRRFAKRLGVGLELWDKLWLHDFVTRECVQVQVKTRAGKVITQWRRRVDPKLPYELGGASQGVEDARAADVDDGGAGVSRPAVHAAERTPSLTVEPTITLTQRQRLGRLIKQTGRNESEVRLWLKARYGVTSDQITQKDYQQIYDKIAVRGVLPMPGDGEG